MPNIDTNQNENKKEAMEKFVEKQSVEFSAKDLRAIAEKLTNSQDSFLNNIKEVTEELKQQAYTLNKLPEKTGEHLLSLIPRISEALHKRVLEDFDHQLELRNAKMTEMFQRLEARHSSIDQSLSASHANQLENLNELNSNFQQAQNIQLKRKILSYSQSDIKLLRHMILKQLIYSTAKFTSCVF